MGQESGDCWPSWSALRSSADLGRKSVAGAGDCWPSIPVPWRPTYRLARHIGPWPRNGRGKCQRLKPHLAAYARRKCHVLNGQFNVAEVVNALQEHAVLSAL